MTGNKVTEIKTGTLSLDWHKLVSYSLTQCNTWKEVNYWCSGGLWWARGLGEVINTWGPWFSSSVPERRPRMLLKCWVRFQPSSERARRVGPGPPLEPSLRLPAAPEGKGGGRMEAGETLWERVSVGRAAEAWRLVALKRPKWQACAWNTKSQRDGYPKAQRQRGRGVNGYL